ncbi:PREDICTED: kelch repeat-containing protein At3g27220-like, partial [Nicotiana attenuata]|uniref:kelch repeat-containing protein At3g27220-like n=1 Tax=Nicotiana attenuata TaxID=49451 RepID=UPI000904BD5D
RYPFVLILHEGHDSHCENQGHHHVFLKSIHPVSEVQFTSQFDFGTIPYRACIAVDDHLYVIGGQEGDFMAKPGSPIFKCSRRFEVVYGDVYMLDEDMKWKGLPSMPKPNSHIECSWVVVNNSIVIVGGTTEKHPVTKRMILVGEVFRFDLNTLTWSVIGKMPYRAKTTLAGFWDGWLYFTSGQRDRGPDNPQPRKVVGDMWRTKLRLSH